MRSSGDVERYHHHRFYRMNTPALNWTRQLFTYDLISDLSQFSVFNNGI